MILDKTIETLEQAVASVLPLSDNIALASQVPVLDDNYTGYVVEAKQVNVSAWSNDGKFPVIAQYNISIVYECDDDQNKARASNSAVALVSALANDAVSFELKMHEASQLYCIVYHVSCEDSNVEITDTRRYLFTATLNVTCQPLLVNVTE